MTTTLANVSAERAISDQRTDRSESEVRAAARAKVELLTYSTGFGNEHSSEALPGALPLGQNSPQKPPYGLYAELVSVTGFVELRVNTRRSWLYRIRPSVVHAPYVRIDNGNLAAPPFRDTPFKPHHLNWEPRPAPAPGTDFVSGLWTLGGIGTPLERTGMAIHIYSANTSMTDRVFGNGDGEMLIIPEKGGLLLHTEMGLISVEPGSIAIIPRSIKFRVEILGAKPGEPESEFVRGYVVENFGTPLIIPELGVIGHGGMANPRDFRVPHAAYHDSERNVEVVHKAGGDLWAATYDHSPLDVVAWHGNAVPYVYNLYDFQVMGPLNFDHPDPSLLTVLTSPTAVTGQNNIDFIIAPPRWIVSEKTFRPAYFHRNVASEYVGVIFPPTDMGDGYAPGLGSLTNMMIPHGVGANVWEHGTNAELVPEKVDGLFFMVETHNPILVTAQADKAVTSLGAETLSGANSLGSNFKK
jgi:homogentisate 1,2-dioxygenase